MSALSRALDGVPAGDVSVIVIWEPVIATDRGAPGRSVTRLLEHDATLLWDEELVGSKAMVRAAMKNPERVPPGFEIDESFVVWDLVATWQPGARWEDDPPMPDWFGTTVVDAEDDLSLRLDPGVRAEIATAWPRVQDTMRRQSERAGPGIADEDGLARTCAERLGLMMRVAIAGDETRRAQAVGWLGTCTSSSSLDVLQRALRDTSPAARLAAAGALAWISNRHQETDARVLRPALDDPAWHVRFVAARHLARDEEDRARAVEVLAPGLRRDDARTRQRVAEALCSAGLPGTRALEAVVFDESAALEVRLDAVRTLRDAWSHPDIEAADRVLARAVRLPDPTLAAEAVAARGMRREAPPEAVADLFRMTDSADPQARMVAFHAIQSPLAEMLQMGLYRGGLSEETLRKAALGSIAFLPPAAWTSAVPVLKELERSARPETRAWATEALAIIESNDEDDRAREQARESGVR